MWLLLYRIFSVAFALVLIAGIIALFVPKVRENRYKEQRLEELEKEYQKTNQQVEDLRQKQKKLISDPDYVGQIAREKLGKVKPGETIFRFDNAQTNTSDKRK